MKHLTKATLGLAVIAVFGLAAAPHTDDDNGRLHAAGWRTIVFDVACDGRTYAPNGVNPATGNEIRGTTFIIDGKIYPGGIIPPGDGFDLDATQGSIAKWVCRGTYNISLEQLMAGVTPALSTAWQILFDGSNALMTEGQEGGTVHRVVLGGTGRYRGVVGEVKEEFLGLNTTGFENYRFTFRIRKAE